MLGGEPAFAQVVIVRASLRKAIPLHHRRVADKSGGLAIDHADQQDEEAGVEDNARHLGPQRPVALRRIDGAPPRGGQPDEHARSDRRVHQDGGDDERPGTEDVEEAEPSKPRRGDRMPQHVTHDTLRVLRQLRQECADDGQQRQDGEQDDGGAHFAELAPGAGEHPDRHGYAAARRGWCRRANGRRRDHRPGPPTVIVA